MLGSGAGFFGNLSDSLVLGLEVDEFLQVFGLGEGVLGTEVIGFADGVFIDELGVAPDLLELEEEDFLAVVLVDADADFDLLDIAEAVDEVLGCCAGLHVRGLEVGGVKVFVEHLKEFPDCHGAQGTGGIK